MNGSCNVDIVEEGLECMVVVDKAELMGPMYNVLLGAGLSSNVSYSHVINKLLITRYVASTAPI